MTATAERPGAPRAPLPARWWARYVTDVRTRVDAESDAYRAVTDPGAADLRVAVILLTTAVALTITNFLADGTSPGWLTTPLAAVGLDGLADRIETALDGSTHAEFHRLAFWTIVQVGGYVLVPALVVRLVLRERVRDLGLRTRGILPQGRTYALLFVVALPVVVAVSFTDAFQAKYPFYDLAPAEGLWPYLWAWWGLYAAQFVALEFFFRGFLVHGLAPRFGFASVLVMVVPYNMIHYEKPMLEALGAIVGGLVLGTLSLKTRSIWWGAALHIAIAGTMDVLALTHAGVLL